MVDRFVHAHNLDCRAPLTFAKKCHGELGTFIIGALNNERVWDFKSH